MRDWNITGGHLAERFRLFVIVAPGESVLVTGTTLGAAAAAIVVGVALWDARLAHTLTWGSWTDVHGSHGSPQAPRRTLSGYTLQKGTRCSVPLMLPVKGGDGTDIAVPPLVA